MMGEPTPLARIWAVKHVVSAIGLLWVLTSLPALAQTNIDQGKSPAELFAGDCATCHKSARGLANGRGSAALAGFLLEHYTASRDQAAALAAYVLGAGGGQAAPATQSRPPKPTPDKPDRASVEEPKPSARTRDRAKQEEPNGPDRRAAPGRREGEPAVASPSHQAVPEPAPSAPPPTPVVVSPPAAVVATPPPPPAGAATPPAAAPSPAMSAPAAPGPSAVAPAAEISGESGPVPRDNIPD
jgi:hypothetical protein